MRKSLLNQYIQEILTFADDEEDVVIESNKRKIISLDLNCV